MIEFTKHEYTDEMETEEIAVMIEYFREHIEEIGKIRNKDFVAMTLPIILPNASNEQIVELLNLFT